MSKDDWACYCCYMCQETERERIIQKIKEAFGEHDDLAHTYGNTCSCEIIATFYGGNS